MAHGDEGVRQCLGGCDSLVSVQPEHPLQQVDELPPVRLLCQHVRALQLRRQVDLEVEPFGEKPRRET